MSNIEIRKIDSKKDLNQFIEVPWTIYKNDPNWVPPKIAVKELLSQNTHF